MIKQLTFSLVLAIFLAACSGSDTKSNNPSPAQPVDIISSPTEIATPTLQPVKVTENIGPDTPTLTQVPTVIAPDPNFVYAQGAIPSSAFMRLGTGFRTASAVSPDGRFFAIGTSVGLFMFDRNTKTQLWSAATRSAVEQLVWTPDSKQVIGRLFEWKNVLIWDAETGNFIRRLESDSEVAGLAVSPGGKKLAVGYGSTSLDDNFRSINGISIWDLEAGSLEVTWSKLPNAKDYDHPVVGLQWSPKGTLLAATVGYGTVAIIDVATGQTLQLLEQPTRGHSEVQHLTFSPDGSMLVTYTGTSGPIDAPGGDRNAYVWDVYSGQQLLVAENTYVVQSASWSSDGSILATISYSNWYDPENPLQDEIRFWEVESWTLLQIFPRVELLNWTDNNDRVILYGPGFSNPEYGDLTTGDRFPAPQDQVPAFVTATTVNASRKIEGRIFWSPDSSLLAVTPFEETDPITIWNAGTGSLVETIESGAPMPDWLTGQPLRPYHDYCESGEPPEVVTDPSQRVSAHFEMVESNPAEYRSPRNTTISLESLTKGFAVVESVFEQDSIVCSAAFSPDARYLAVGHMPLGRGVWGIQNTNIDDNYVTVWDVQTGELRAKFLGHTGTVEQLAWSPDGQWLASVSLDGSVLIWNIN